MNEKDLLESSFCGIKFKNPIVPASGTFGYGREFEEFYPLSALGGYPSRGLQGRGETAIFLRGLPRHRGECSTAWVFRIRG